VRRQHHGDADCDDNEWPEKFHDPLFPDRAAGVRCVH
jgi:hypothetical protein